MANVRLGFVPYVDQRTWRIVSLKGTKLGSLGHVGVKLSKYMAGQRGQSLYEYNETSPLSPLYFLHLARAVGTTKMCRKEQNLSETDRFCVLGPLELVERGTYNRFI